jgi:ligand-binding sensor domain-containing protein
MVGDWATFTHCNDVREMTAVADTIWSATSGGLLRISSKTGTVQKYTNVDGLSSVDILSVHVDRLHKLWLGTNGAGVTTFHPATGRWRRYTEFDGVAGKVVQAIWAGYDRVWVGTEKGISLFEWNPGENAFYWKENYLSEKGVPVKNIRTLLDWNDEIWVGMDGGVARARYRHPNVMPNLQDSSSWTTYDESDGLSNNQVNAFVVIDSVLWAGTEKGVSVFEGGSWIPKSEGLPEHLGIYDLINVEDEVWAATSSGIYKYTDRWRNIFGEDKTFPALTTDQDGTIWAGSDGEGMYYQTSQTWNHVMTEGPASNNIFRVALDREGDIWVTTRAPFYISTADRFSDGLWTTFDESDELRTGERMPALFVDPMNRKWLGSWGGGVNILDDQGTIAKTDDVIQYLDEENSGLRGIQVNPQFVVITDIEQDRQGNFWFLNYLGVESGLVVCDSSLSRWTAYSVRDGLIYPEVQALAIDQQGIKWIGTTQEGMSRFDDAGTPFDKEDDDPDFSWITYSESSTDPSLVIVNDNVTSICVDREGTVWIGTSAGMMRYTNFYFSMVEGLHNGSVNSVIADARNNIWVGTDGGLSFYDVEENQWMHFTTENSDLVSDRVQDIAIDVETGMIWVATDRGLSRYESGIIPPITDMKAVNVYPNPFFPTQAGDPLVIAGLADGSMVSIYTLNGELIRELDMPRHQLNQIRWDGKNEAGALVSTGIYLFLATNQAGLSRVGKIAVVR